MRVRQLYGTRAGEIVEMPYVVALRAIASGTVEDLEPRRPVVPTGLAVASATQVEAGPTRVTASAVETSPGRPPRRTRPLTR